MGMGDGHLTNGREHFMRMVPQHNARSGFTLVELLVVLAIVLLASLVAIPTLVTNLNGRQITDAARILTGALVGMRDSAIRYNSPRGLRFLPDSALTLPAPGLTNAGQTQLCYNRMIPIEPAGDYSAGRVSIGPQLTAEAGKAQTNFPPLYPRSTSGQLYPYLPTAVSPAVSVSDVLMIEESPYVGGFVVAGAAAIPNEPTSWYWNVRLGDKIKVGASGRSYTVVGPCVVNPWNDLGSGIGNAELFVNVGPPGTTLPLTRTYYLQDGTIVGTKQPEFLFLVNGEDDNLDGYTDSGWDGFDHNSANGIDDLAEWETETWAAALSGNTLQDVAAGTDSPSSAWVTNFFQSSTHDVPYIITRRPVPSPGAREIALPAGMVVDATTWNSTRERSRIPVTPGSLFCDIMVDPSGAYIPTTEYSTPTSGANLPFLHFWLTDRNDVYPVGSIPTSAGVSFLLPMTSSALGLSGGVVVAPTEDGQFYPDATALPVLKNDRRLVTMFAQTGLVTTNPIESIAPPNGYQPGEGFCVGSVDYPFYKAQLGQREAR